LVDGPKMEDSDCVERRERDYLDVDIIESSIPDLWLIIVSISLLENLF
jgi:hypothetical protein